MRQGQFNETINIRDAADIKQRLASIAEREKRPVSDLARRAIRQFIEQQERGAHIVAGGWQ